MCPQISKSFQTGSFSALCWIAFCSMNIAACGCRSRPRSPGTPAPLGLRPAGGDPLPRVKGSMARELGRETQAARGGDHNLLPGAFYLRYQQRMRRGEPEWKIAAIHSERASFLAGHQSRIALYTLIKRWDVVGGNGRTRPGFGSGGQPGRSWGGFRPRCLAEAADRWLPARGELSPWLGLELPHCSPCLCLCCSSRDALQRREIPL